MPSEIEKLRALLAEARVITQDSLDSNTTGFEAENEVCKCNACERYRSIIARIDAALAEPVGLPLGVTWQSVKDLALSAARERDEARAEVERLKTELASWRGNFDGPLAFVRDHVEKAFKRGAEAMREAAATAVFDRHTTGLLSPAAVTAAVRVIRALPLPEDK